MWVLIYDRQNDMLHGGDVYVFATRQDAEDEVIAYAQDTYEGVEGGEPQTFEDAKDVLSDWDHTRVVLVERDMMRSE